MRSEASLAVGGTLGDVEPVGFFLRPRPRPPNHRVPDTPGYPTRTQSGRTTASTPSKLLIFLVCNTYQPEEVRIIYINSKYSLKMSKEENDALLSKIFEMVNTKAAEKPKRKRRAMTPEQKAKAIENLKRGRATALKNRKAKMEAKKANAPSEPAPPPPPKKEEPPPPPPPKPKPATPPPPKPATPPPPPKPKTPPPPKPDTPPPKPATPPPPKPAREPTPPPPPVRAPTPPPKPIAEPPIRLSAWGRDRLW